MSNVLLVNITWNPTGWRNTYVNPKAGHSYAREHVGQESLNFKFGKKGIDTKKNIYGFFQYKNPPKRFENGGLVIFYTRNTDINTGQIIGVYGKTEVFKEPDIYYYKGFLRNKYHINMRAEKHFSILFPIPLEANKYKRNSSDRMVGQIGFTYKDIKFAHKVLSDELIKLSKAGILESDYKKLSDIYKCYIGKKFQLPFISNDENEQNELESFYRKRKSRQQLLNDLANLRKTDSEEVIVQQKTYKRDNKTIAQLKVLRDFKCQICKTTIMKKDGKKYIEAAHIRPKSKRGRETPDNILILCPNHHKEFDYGKLKIIKHTDKYVEFVLNQKEYKVSLKLK